MKIYYAHSIKWSHIWWEWEPSDVIPILQSRWHEILSEEIYTINNTLTDIDIFIRDKSMVDESDLILANLTNPSLWVWYELWYAEAQWKKIIWFFQWNITKRISSMIAGNKNIPVYNIEILNELEQIIKNFTS